MIENFSAQHKQAKPHLTGSVGFFISPGKLYFITPKSRVLMESQIIIQWLSTEASMLLPSHMVVEKMTSKNKEITPPGDVWLSPKKAVELFSPKITIQTLNSWAKQGLFHREIKGGRVFFSQNGILEKRTILKKYNRTI